MTKNREPVLVAFGRTALARANKGSFAETHPVEYGAQALRGILDKVPKLDRAEIDDVIVGCAQPERYLGWNAARLISQRAGLPDSVPAHIVNRFCSSGLQSVATAANAISAGEMDVVVAGGIEMMTNINMELAAEYQYKALIEQAPASYMAMGLTGELVAERYAITRHEMEVFAVESHKRAASAKDAGKFTDEIIPVEVKTQGGVIKLAGDEGVRAGTNLQALAELKPCFKEDGLLTAATSSQMTDGASFVVLMSREKAQSLGIAPIARFVSFSVAGLAPEVMGLGPIYAVPKVLKKTGLTLESMDVIELNEAFASQAIACIRDLNLPPEKTNPNGGAIALGHPMGATGSVLICKALSQLIRTGGRYAMITMCIGGGMGAAGIIEIE
ncbi:MAG: thiolase family protein [Spirochaetes bacterium]|nr:thiolase family protein [Spirochaetota bacterium]